MVLLVLAFSCGGEPPRIDAVDPAKGAAGVAVKVVGERFPADATATLGGQPLEELTVRGATLLEGRVPAQLPVGAHALVLSGGGAELARLEGAYTVEAPPPEDKPCAGEYTAYSAVATDTQTVKIDRFYAADKRQEQLSFGFREITGVEYEEVLLADGRLCSVIFLRTQDGRRVMFDDDTEERLRGRAQELAVGLGKDISVREAPEAPAPGGP